ncbi:MAG: hypothetical protein HFE63_10420 [Clostridiales bacterium]|nr:hypothetical protein [Clostridiales bacterium]
MKKICPHCGSVQSADQIECSVCGLCLSDDIDTDDCAYNDNVMYYVPELWTKFAAAALFVLAAVEIFLMMIYGSTHNILTLFFGMLGAAISGFAFLFPLGFCRFFIYLGENNRYNIFWHGYTSFDEIDYPSPAEAHRMFIVFAIISILSLAAMLYFIVFRPNFIIK